MYGLPYRKATAIWTNLGDYWLPRAMCTKAMPCVNVVDGKHTTRAQIRHGWTTKQLYVLPHELCMELAKATTEACYTRSPFAPILSMLRTTTIPYEKRLRVRDAGALKKRGMVLGLVIDYAVRHLVVSKHTRRFAELARTACALIKEFYPSFVFTSIMVNMGASTLHIDGNNNGPSVIVSLGVHTGGQLWQYPGDILTIAAKPTECDGLIPHVTLPYIGERYSLVYYCIRTTRAEPSPQDAAFLESLGFNSVHERPPSGKPRGDLLKEAAVLVAPLLNGIS